MTTHARTALSATALGLASFTATSSIASGLFATPTMLGLALLAVYGMLEITLLSYAMPRKAATRSPAPAAVRLNIVRRVPALIEYPVIRGRETCRACAA